MTTFAPDQAPTTTPATAASVAVQRRACRWACVAWFLVAVAIAAGGWVARQYGYPQTGWVVTAVAVLPGVVAYRWARRSDRLAAHLTQDHQPDTGLANK